MITILIQLWYILTVYGIDAPLEDWFNNPAIVDFLYQIVHIIKSIN